MKYICLLIFCICFSSCKKNEVSKDVNKDTQNSNQILKYYKNGLVKERIFNITKDTIEVGNIEIEDVVVYVVLSMEGFSYYGNQRNSKKEYFKYVKGNREGEWLYWDEKEVLLCSEKYLDNLLVSTIEYNTQ